MVCENHQPKMNGRGYPLQNVELPWEEYNQWNSQDRLNKGDY
jgi:hypothetical protein